MGDSIFKHHTYGEAIKGFSDEVFGKTFWNKPLSELKPKSVPNLKKVEDVKPTPKPEVKPEVKTAQKEKVKPEVKKKSKAEKEAEAKEKAEKKESNVKKIIKKLMSDEITKETQEFYDTATKEDRKKAGQFYSSSKVVNRAFEKIDVPLNASVLEPSCGSGQFLDALMKKGFTNITGVEMMKAPYDLAKAKYEPLGVKIVQHDYLTYSPDTKYDLIIGNPPYQQVKGDIFKDVKATYKKLFKDVSSGTMDLYGLFVVKGIKQLNDGGTLCFVIPVSILTSPFFQKIRDYIHSTCSIEHISIMPELDLFPDAKVEVMVFQIKKGTPNNKYISKSGSNIIFSQKESNAEDVQPIGQKLKEIGKVKIGSISPNKIETGLTETKTNTSLPIIYGENIGEGVLVFDNKKLKGKRMQFLEKSAHKSNIKAPFIIMNRTIGKGKKITMALVKEGEFFPENHTIFITSDNHLQQIYDRLSDKEYQKTFVENIRGHVPSITKAFLDEIYI